MKLLVLLILLANPVFASEYRVVKDADRQRDIPIQISYPMDVSLCSAENLCPVAFLSSGYGVAYDKYSFILDALNKAGYLVVAIQHELPGDQFDDRRQGCLAMNETRGDLVDDLYVQLIGMEG